MKYYHGSIVPNLKTLLPFNTSNSLSKKECVYLTARKEMALLYIWVRKFMWLTYGFDKNGTVVFTETHKDALKEFYKNVKGFIYTVEMENTQNNDTEIRDVITVYEPTDVRRREEVKDAYKKILEYEKQGNIIIRRYESLSIAEIENNKNMIMKELNNEVYNKNEVLLGYIKFTFPDIYAEYERQKTKDS